jgi:hypothetical protein
MTVKKHLVQFAVAVVAFVATLSVALATAPVSRATDLTTTSQYVCPSSTPWLCKGGIAGYKCFQYPQCTGRSSKTF